MFDYLTAFFLKLYARYFWKKGAVVVLNVVWPSKTI